MRSLVFLLLALVLPLAGCGDTDSTGPSPSVGTYALQLVNNAALPATVIAAGPFRREVTAGEISLAGDGSFSSTFSLRETNSGVVSSQTTTTVGTYRQEENALLLRATTGEEILGTLAGNTLTLILAGNVYVFQR